MSIPIDEAASKKPRKRARNFTEEEETLLLKLVDTYKECIENKKSNAVIWRQKEEAWKTIEDKFAAITGLYRNSRALRDKYEFIKRKTRSESFEQNLDANSTMSTMFEKVDTIYGDSATDLPNSYNNDIKVEFDSLESVDPEESTFDSFQQTNTSMEKNGELSAYKDEKADKDLIAGGKRKKNIEDEKLELIVLQQKFYRDENIRAQQKHEQELLSLKLKNEIQQMELSEKRMKNIEEQKLELIILQQKFYRDQNIRAQEKHEQEILSLKLKNKILEMELSEKKAQ